MGAAPKTERLAFQYDVRHLLADADTVVIDDFRAVLQERLGPLMQSNAVTRPRQISLLRVAGCCLWDSVPPRLSGLTRSSLAEPD